MSLLKKQTSRFRRWERLAPTIALLILGPALGPLLLGCTRGNTDIGGPCGAPRSYFGSSTSGDPCAGDVGGGQFYYPSGIAVSPNGFKTAVDTIYISNSNADLRYSGGTVMALDVGFFECAMALASAAYDMSNPRFVERCKNPGDYPNLSKIHDAFDKPFGEPFGCRVDLSNPAVIECDEDGFIRAAVRVGNFAGSIRVQTPPSTVAAGASERLWLPARGDRSITFVDVVPGLEDAYPHHLQCTDPNPLPLHIQQQLGGPGDYLSRRIADSCVAQTITTRDYHKSNPQDLSAPGFPCSPDAAMLRDTSKCVPIPAEPFGIYLDQGCQDAKSKLGTPRVSLDSCKAGSDSYAHLLVTALSTGEVTYIDANVTDPVSTPDRAPKERVVLDVRGNFFPADTAGRRGTFGIAPREPGNPSSWWYLTSRLNAQMAMFRLADVGLVLPGPTFALNSGPYAAGASNDVRQLVFDPCTADNPGCRAFVVDNNPPSVFTLDTRVDAMVGMPAGIPRNQVVDIVDICQGPSRIAFRHLGHRGERSVDRVYVTCFTSGQMLVIDPDLSELVGNITVGRGADEVAFNFDSDHEVDDTRGPWLSAPAHRRAYVANFVDNTIAVIDLDARSPTENQVIGRIGLTNPPRVQ